MVVSKEATHCPPIGSIKVPESTFRAWWNCWRESIRLWSELPIGGKMVYLYLEGVVVKHKSSMFKNWLGRSGMCVGSLISCSRSLRILNDLASLPPVSV